MERSLSAERPPDLDVIKEILLGAKTTCDSIEGESGIVKEGVAYGDHLADTQTKADEAMSNYADQTLRGLYPDTPIRIMIEGKDEIRIGQENPQYSWYVDPLDASLNREKKGETIGLPYSFAISVFEGYEHTYLDYISAGVIDLRSGDNWISQKDLGCFVNGKLSHTSGNTSVDLGKYIGIAEQYYPFNRHLFSYMFTDQKGYLRSPGSAAVEMAKIAHGEVDFFISAFQKSDVLGTAFAHLNEAGGYASDMRGNPLGTRVYEFTKPIEEGVILGSTKELVEELVQRTQFALDKLAEKKIKIDYPKID